MRRYSQSTFTGKKNCGEYVITGIQYLLAIVLLLGYFLFLPIVPYFALFEEDFAYLETGYINDNYFHCTYDYILIEYEHRGPNLAEITTTLENNETLSETRSDVIYWGIFLIFAIISSIFGYYIILICPAFKICLKSYFNENMFCREKVSKLDCCSWKIWILTSIISLLFIISALILALEKPCNNEVSQLYRDYNNNNTDIRITDVEFGYSLWFLLIVFILNVIIICICSFTRNDDLTQYKQSLSDYKTIKKYGADERGALGRSGCEYCNDKRYIKKGCLRKTKCPICNDWELDDF